MVENTEEIGTTTLWLATQARVCKAAKFAVSESQRQFPSPCECLRTYFSEAGQLVTSCTLNFSGLDRLTPDMIPLIWYLKHVEITRFQQTLKRQFQWCWPRSNEPIASFFLAVFIPHDTVKYSWQNRFRHLLWISDWFYCWQGTTEQWIPQCFHIRLVLYNSSKNQTRQCHVSNVPLNANIDSRGKHQRRIWRGCPWETHRHNRTWVALMRETVEIR